MGSVIMSESWFSALWRSSRRSVLDDKAIIGILAYEVASLMLKVVNLWHCLSDKEVLRLRQEIVNSIGIRKMVSDDEDYLMELALNEILENFEFLARSVARLSKRCVNPVYHQYENFVDDPIQNVFQWTGWEYRWKKMERKVKKMERFVSAMTQLSQEMEVLAELEQTLRRMQANARLNRVKLLDFQQKVISQRQQVKGIQDMSPWNRTYDYIVRLLARSLFTILERIIHIFGNNHVPTEMGKNVYQHMHNDCLPRSHSFSALTSVHPSESDLCRLNPVSKPGLTAYTSRTKNKKQQARHNSPALCGKDLSLETKSVAYVGTFIRCMSNANDSPVVQSCMPTTGGSMRLSSFHVNSLKKMELADTVSFSCRNSIYSKLSTKCRLLRPPPSTLGDAALALHYANVIILIERMVSSPHLIDPDMRNDLYNLLPTTIRTSLRFRLKFHAKKKVSFVYDAAFAAEWSHTLTEILDWLAPLAHNMKSWNSDRNFEEQHSVSFSQSNVLLVQTLYFASQVKTEAAILELLVGLNYVCRSYREPGVKDLSVSTSYSVCNYVCQKDNDVFCEVI
ncbi:hypothetical protein O6P43_009508 [Quillaja saponaria]|uniref:DUF668 domain-containing protein n=1 Tax=Quillaja saponaria TaxID=32244 RepID=A0AAD7VD24_QUISA|nr:hypothetical protein O6P43_009508 [Quillaja saponaria]